MCQPPGTVPGPRQYEWNWLPTAITRCPHMHHSRVRLFAISVLLRLKAILQGGPLQRGRINLLLTHGRGCRTSIELQHAVECMDDDAGVIGENRDA
jgi:hypothetical protein